MRRPGCVSVSASVSRGKYRQIFIRKRRDDEEEEEDNGDSVDATLTGKEGSPRKPPVLYRIISCPTDMTMIARNLK